MIGGYLVVLIGSGLGAALRHGVNHASVAYLGAGVPIWHTDSERGRRPAGGVLAELFLVKDGSSQEFRLFLTTSVLGGFTTFSAFSLDAALMWQQSEYAALASYVFASVFLSIAALVAGMADVRALT